MPIDSYSFVQPLTMRAFFVCLFIIVLGSIGVDGACTLREAAPYPLVSNRTALFDWIFGNFTVYSAPYTNECVSLSALHAAMYPYEDAICLLRYSCSSEGYLSDCGAPSGSLCYDTKPSTSSCTCIGTSHDYQCAQLATINKARGKPLRVPMPSPPPPMP